MGEQEARYTLTDGRTLVVSYDPLAPWRICGEPVGEASMGGTDVCPACDCGYNRDGTRWDIGQTMARIGPNSPAAQRLRDRPLTDLDHDNLPEGFRIEQQPHD